MSQVGQYIHLVYFVTFAQDESVFSGKCPWNVAEEESLLDAMDLYSFGNWYTLFCFYISASCYSVLTC